jgi:hypothetical protein
VPDFLNGALGNEPTINVVAVSFRLVLGLLFGGVVALVYRISRPPEHRVHSFYATLVLLTVLIAMVTQVIGDSVARAFSLVGALSIVRFRTVVRDTQDTAYVIFAVVVGMAVGASNPWVAVIGILVVAVAAVVLRAAMGPEEAPMPYLVEVRLEADRDPRSVLTEALNRHIPERRVVSMSSAKQGEAFDVTYRTKRLGEDAAAALVKGVTAVDGVMSDEIKPANED